MAHTETYIDPNEGFQLDRLAQVTGNPMWDVGYQCMDARPYFEFYNSGLNERWYTTVHPNRCPTARNVLVYEKTTVVHDGESYVAMSYIGPGVQTGTSLVANSADHAYTGTTLTVRMFCVNKWAKCKPIRVNKWGALTDADRSAYDYGLVKIDSAGGAGYSRSGYRYNVPVSGDYFRLTDFAGYNALAECPIKDLRDTFSGDFDVEATHLFSADDIIARGVNVEISLPGMDLRGNWFLGYFFKRLGDPDSAGFYHTFNVRLQDAVAAAGTQGTRFEIDDYEWDEGDTIVIDVIVVFQSNPVQDAEDVRYGKLSSAENYFFLCPDTGEVQPRGRALVIAANCWANSYRYLSFSSIDASATPSGAGYNVSFTVTFIALTTGDTGTREDFYYAFYGSINGTSMTESSKTRVTSPLQNGQTLTGKPVGTVYVSSADMRDNSGYVLVGAGLRIYKWRSQTETYELVDTITMSERNIKVVNGYD